MILKLDVQVNNPALRLAVVQTLVWQGEKKARKNISNLTRLQPRPERFFKMGHVAGHFLTGGTLLKSFKVAHVIGHFPAGGTFCSWPTIHHPRRTNPFIPLILSSQPDNTP